MGRDPIRGRVTKFSAKLKNSRTRNDNIQRKLIQNQQMFSFQGREMKIFARVKESAKIKTNFSPSEKKKKKEKNIPQRMAN